MEAYQPDAETIRAAILRKRIALAEVPLRFVGKRAAIAHAIREDEELLSKVE